MGHEAGSIRNILSLTTNYHKGGCQCPQNCYPRRRKHEQNVIILERFHALYFSLRFISHCSELKRAIKKAEKERQKAEKDKLKAAKAAANPKPKKKKQAEDEVELDPSVRFLRMLLP